RSVCRYQSSRPNEPNAWIAAVKVPRWRDSRPETRFWSSARVAFLSTPLTVGLFGSPSSSNSRIPRGSHALVTTREKTSATQCRAFVLFVISLRPRSVPVERDELDSHRMSELHDDVEEQASRRRVRRDLHGGIDRLDAGHGHLR